MKVETLSWLASNTRYTKRYERHIGRLCRELTVKRVTELERLSWYQVRHIETNYMNDIVSHFGKITRLRAVWIGGEGRREEDLDLFYNMLSDSQKKTISIVVMDMWKPFRKATLKHIPHAQRNMSMEIRHFFK